MTNIEHTVARFKNPPIAEKVMAIEFEPLRGWEIPHFGLFWRLIQDEFPSFDVLPAALPAGVDIDFDLIRNSSRCRFFNKAEEQMIQIQSDRFIFNWLKPTAHEQYPRHESIRPEFGRQWSKFCRFLSESDISMPQITKCEITYINHLERGREWNKVSDLPFIINGWSGLSGNLLSEEPDFLVIQTGYSMPEGNGQLAIRLQPAVRGEDHKELFQLLITAVGKPELQDIDSILSWFDMGRTWVIQGFVDFTSNAMHELWQKD